MSSRRKIYMVTNAGVPTPGQAPVAATWLLTGGGVPAPAAPTVVAIGGGAYYFDVPLDLDGDATLIIDNDPGGTTGIPAAERYSHFSIVRADLNLGPLVRWAHPRGEPRALLDESDMEGAYFFYVYLEGRDGEPLTGVGAGDLENVEVTAFREQASAVTVTVAPANISWTEVGAAFPGLYSFSLDNDNGGAGGVGGNEHIYASFRLSSDPSLTHVWSAHTDSGVEGDQGGDFIVSLVGIQLLLNGVNSRTTYTSFADDGNPTEGRLDFYTDSAAATTEDPDGLVASAALSYEYDGMGRLSSQTQVLDPLNQQALFAWLQSLSGGGEDEGDGASAYSPPWLVFEGSGGSDQLFTSSDAYATSSTSSSGLNDVKGVVEAPSGSGEDGIWVACGLSGLVGYAYRGLEESSWTQVTGGGLSGVTEDFNAAAVWDDGAGTGMIVLVGNGGRIAWASIDNPEVGGSWSTTVVAGNPDFTDIDCDGSGRFIATGSDGPYWADVVADPATWAACSMASISGEPVYAVRWINELNGGAGGWVVISQSGIVEDAPASATPNSFSLALGAGTLPTHCRSLDVATEEGTIVAVGGSGVSGWAYAGSSSDLTSWTDLQTPTPGQFPNRVRYGADGDAGRFVVVGNAGTLARQGFPLNTGGDGWTKSTLGVTDLYALYGPPSGA